MAMLFSVMSFAQAETYSYTFTKNVLSTSGGSVDLGGITWSYPAVGYAGYDTNNGKGQQFGSSSKPAKDFTFSAIIPGEIQSITINAATASSATANLKVTVGDTEYINSKLSTSSTDYTGTGASSGEIKINFTQTTSKALYIKKIVVVYNPNAGGPVKESVTLNWSASTCDAILGVENQFPTLSTTPADLAGVTYSSSNEEVATINATTGAVELVGGGTTDIVASFEETDDYYAAEAKYTLTVLATTEDTWNLVTDASTLKVGDEVIIAAAEASVAMSTTQNSNNRGVALVVKGENTLTATNQVQVFTLEAGSSEGTFAFNTGAGYLWAASNSSNHLKTGDLLNDHASWTITIAEGVTSVVATNSTNRNVMQYNESSQLFSCYSSASQKPLALYKKYIEPVVVNHTITVTANPAEAGVVEGAGEYEEGKTATLTATANEGYEFVNWTVGEEVVSTENPYTFNVTADVALVANFQEAVAVTTKEEKSACPAGTLVDGKVIHELESCTIVQEQGESTTALKSVSPWQAPAKSIMTITPKEGVTIQQYIVNTKNTTLGTYIGKSELTNATKTATNNGLVTFTVTNGTEPVVMKFVSTTIKFCELTIIYTVAGGSTDPEPVKYTITVKAENGTVEGAGEYEENAEATLTATAAEGYEFVNWTVDGTEVSTENPYTFAVTADIALVANFKAVVVEEPLPEGVPTNAELWEAFKPYYNTYYGLTRADQPIDKVSTFAAAKMQEIMTDAASEYKWLGDYVLGVAAGQGVNLPTDMAAANEGAWRWAVHAFFNATTGANGAAGTDFTEAGKPQAWGPYYLAAQQKPEEPVMETVYFVNALNWTGTINAYAWDPVQNANWPGVAATKEAEQIAGYDVYSYTAEAGTYKNIIFNGTGGQTADLVWTAGKYYVKDGWYTKEEAEAKLAKPVEYESVYFVDNQGWGKANIYTWTPEVGTWPGVAMTKEAEQLAGYDVYSYTVEKGTSFGGVIFNNGSGVQTGDLKWTAGKYYVKDAWYTKEEAEAKLAGPVTPPVITYVLMGVKGDWTTGIALTQNPDNANEYVLLGQEILEGDAVKVVTLTDGVATAWCGNVDEYSVERTFDDMGNIVLAPGKYDFYYKVAEDLIYIGGEAYPQVVTHTIEGEVLEKNDGRYLTLVAEDETHGYIELNIFGYDGLSESYSISGAIDGVNVEGTCTYTVDEEAGTETLVASVVTDDATVKYEITLVYTIPAAQQYLIMMTEGIEAVSQVEEWEDIDEEGNPVTIRIASYSWYGSNEEWEVYIEAGETIEGAYIYGSAANLTTGQVAELSVVEDSYAIEENYGILSIWGVFTDGLNTYELYLEGQLPVVEEEGTTKYITVENADIAPGMDIATDLEIWAEDEDYNTIMIALTEGTTKMYGDYTAEELYISYNWETATLLEETVGTYKLDGEVAVFEATVLCGADTLVLSISGTPFVNPATIVPVDTVEMKFYEGTVGYRMGTTNIAGTNAEATLNIGIIGADESNMYDQEWSADDLSWNTTLTIADKEVIFIYGTVTIKKDGDDKVVTASLLGDDHVLYVITLTAGKELTTGLENLDTTVAPAKAIVNGQLVIIKNGVQYNVQGAIVK